MTATFRRRCESATSLLSFHPTAFRVGSVLLAATLLLILTACSTAHGITRVGTTEQEAVAGALSISSQHEGSGGEYSYFVSENGGETWRPSDAPMEVQWSEGTVNTPRGTFRIQGPDIMLTTTGRGAETVFSAASWRTSSNQWFQEIKTNGLEYRLEPPADGRALSKGPVAIAYDPSSGNVIAAAGIMGVVIGTPDGQWRSVAVGDYTPVEFSSSAKLKALLSQNIFWATVVTFPFLMIALAFFFKDLFHEGFISRKNSEHGEHRDTTVKLSHGFQSQRESSMRYHVRRSRSYHLPTAAYGDLRLDAMSAISVLFLFMSLFSLAFMWVLGSGINNERWIWLPVAILVGASVLASITAWKGQWKVHWGGLAGSYLAMVVFVAVPFLIWAGTGLPLAFLKTLAIVLCLATAVLICLRLNYKPSSPSGVDESDSEVDRLRPA